VLPAYETVFVLAITAMVIRYLFLNRRARAARIAGIIAASMRHNLPLAEALETAAIGAPRKDGRILQRIAAGLADGAPLTTAVDLGYRRCPGHLIAMIAAAEPIGRLPQAMQAVHDDLARRIRLDTQPRPVNPVYPVIVAGALLLLLVMLPTLILPNFQKIFADMGERLPAATQSLLDSLPLLRAWAVIIVLFVLVAVPLGIYAKFRSRTPDRPWWLSRLTDALKWRLPGLHWFERNYSLLRTARALRLAIDAGCSLDHAMQNTLLMDVNASFRKRLEAWCGRVLRGDNVADAARRSRLPEPLAWAFDQSANPGNTPAALEVVESTCRLEYGYRRNLARSIFWPCVTLAMAALVGYVVYAVFAPISAMLDTITVP
jgi:type II secretory pathway component PulF